jgi:apolipoprotein N-acyltransferase
MRTIHYITLAVTSGILLWLSFPPNGIAWLAFVAFVPLLAIEHEIYYLHPGKKVYQYGLLGFVVWNALTTWWIWYSTDAGSIMAILANSFLMLIPFSLFHNTSRWLGRRWGYLLFTAYWLSFEYLHFNWELTWTWLTLGNVLSSVPAWAQLYEYTGAMGGTVWILLINFVIFWVLRRAVKTETPKQSITRLAYLVWIPLTIILVPILISTSIYKSYEESDDSISVVIVQPNIDPYNEKFGGLTADEQLQILIDLSKDSLTAETDYLVWPETSIQHLMWIHELNEVYPIQMIKKMLEPFPNTKLVAGFTPVEKLSGKDASPTARRSMNGTYYDLFNSAVQIDASDQLPIYHKSKLVVGVERMPYPAVFKFLEPLAINLGGSVGSMGTQEERSVFFRSDSSLGVAPVICYESVMGAFLGDFMVNGANFIFIITNDGWWGNTPGHKQHVQFATLRAIEARRSIARSANTGISCFINQRGDISQATNYWEPAVITGKINSNSKVTFYAQHGDYLGRIGSFIATFAILLTLVRRFTSRKKKTVT